MVPRLLSSLLLGLALTLSPQTSALAATCELTDLDCQQKPNTSGDQGSGAVVTEAEFPGDGDGGRLGRARAEAADCPECEWTIAPACLEGSPTEESACAGATQTCANPNAIRYRVYMRVDATAPWQLIDTVCLGPGQRPPTVADVGRMVRERVVNYLPDADPSFQPPEGGLVNLPTIFAAGEPGSIRTEPFDVLGFQVVVTATARWEWTFDRGVTERFSEPGGAYPNDAVSFTYADPGPREVSVTTFWTASFTVDGEGPFAVPGPEISKTAQPVQVPVREARSVLVGG